MLIRKPRGWELPEREATPESAVLGRRRVLGALGFGTIGALSGCAVGLGADVKPTPPPPPLRATRDSRFSHDGKLTDEKQAGRYNNFYEFSQDKDVWRHVEKLETRPWRVEVGGLVHKPRSYEIDDLLKLPLEERLYRHRCVEAWYMDVPWIGFPLRQLLDASQPLARATHVRFVSLLNKEQMPGQKASWYTWPYYEALTLGEAMNELTLATVGIYGHELPKQHGAPLRVVVPWKYGYKGPKAVVKIELVEGQPHTFWNDQQPLEYSFVSNVNPQVPHPRWSQASERAIDGGPSRKTRLYNGYGEWVAQLYRT
jgi:sulfoxide reductase catalytic subunit YedY